VRARAFIDLAIKRLAENPDYALSDGKLLSKQGSRDRFMDKHATVRQTLRRAFTSQPSLFGLNVERPHLSGHGPSRQQGRI
jgi:hypothetical protein